MCCAVDRIRISPGITACSSTQAVKSGTGRVSCGGFPLQGVLPCCVFGAGAGFDFARIRLLWLPVPSLSILEIFSLLQTYTPSFCLHQALMQMNGLKNNAIKVDPAVH